MSEESHPFFVYGTLLPNQPNYFLCQQAIQTMQPATLRNGRLLDLGHYPMLIETEDGLVYGQVITIKPDAYELIVAKLDYLEGFNPDQPKECEYIRAKRMVQLTDNTAVTVWVYIGQARYTDHIPLVPNGDWAAHVKNRQQNSAHWWQNTHTVSGLHDDLI